MGHTERAFHTRERQSLVPGELHTSPLLAWGTREQVEEMALVRAERTHYAQDAVEPVRLSAPAFGRYHYCSGAVRAGQGVAESPQQVATAWGPSGRLCRGQTSSVGSF